MALLHFRWRADALRGKGGARGKEERRPLAIRSSPARFGTATGMLLASRSLSCASPQTYIYAFRSPSLPLPLSQSVHASDPAGFLQSASGYIRDRLHPMLMRYRRRVPIVFSATAKHKADVFEGNHLPSGLSPALSCDGGFH
jgi:hypothetical protein